MKDLLTERWEEFPSTLKDGIVSFHKINYPIFEDGAYAVRIGNDTVIGAITLEYQGGMQWRYVFNPGPEFQRLSSNASVQRKITKRFYRQITAYMFMGE